MFVIWLYPLLWGSFFLFTSTPSPQRPDKKILHFKENIWGSVMLLQFIVKWDNCCVKLHKAVSFDRSHVGVEQMDHLQKSIDFTCHMSMMRKIKSTSIETTRFPYAGKDTRFTKKLELILTLTSSPSPSSSSSQVPPTPSSCIWRWQTAPGFPLVAPSKACFGVGGWDMSLLLCVCCKYFLQSKSQTSELGLICGSP